jgi:hypothetical protein
MPEVVCDCCGKKFHRDPRAYCSRDCYVKSFGDPIERFWAKTISGENGCIVWKGSISTSGYGRITLNGKPKQAHRFSFEQANGPIPEGLQIDHVCRNRACVNPDHLRLVTSKQNTLANSNSPSAINARKSHCPRGHIFTPENTSIPKSNPHRRCKACDRERSRRTYKKMKLRHANRPCHNPEKDRAAKGPAITAVPL